MHDDRLEFMAARRAHSLELGADAELNHRALELAVASARHRFTYLWTWLGVPIIQLPADIVVTQEIIWETRPDIIIETGVARGGSLILSASILQLLGRGKVIGVDIEIRAHNRETIEQHPLAHRIELVEGSSIDARTIDQVRASIPPDARVMVLLDSNHTHEHVLAELRAYSPLVTPGQFLIVSDTIAGADEAREVDLRPLDHSNNPLTAVTVFLREEQRFKADPVYNGKLMMTSSPGGYLRRNPS